MTSKKKRISTSAAKAKGRRLQQWVCQKVSDISGIPWGKDELIRSREMGQSGTDICVIGEAAVVFPYATECKNQEKWSLPEWIKQAKENQKDKLDWLLVCKKNHHEPIVVMDAEHFFDLYCELLECRERNKSRLNDIGLKEKKE